MVTIHDNFFNIRMKELHVQMSLFTTHDIKGIQNERGARLFFRLTEFKGNYCSVDNNLFGAITIKFLG